MAFDEKTVAELCRQRLKKLVLDDTIAIIWAIPAALDALGRKVAQNPKKRSLLMTERITTEFPLEDDGSIDLNEFQEHEAYPEIYVEYLHHGTIWHLNEDEEIGFQPLQPLPGGIANLYQPPVFSDYDYWYLDGMILRTLAASHYLSGHLLFNVPFHPRLADLDTTARRELHNDLIEKIIEIVLGPAVDSAEDGEK